MGMDDQGGRFRTTSWSRVYAARTEHPERRRAAVGAVSARYWKPVYVFLRGKGYAHDDAEELTQGFFVDVVVGRELIQLADREKGSFRALLRKAVACYAANKVRDRCAKKRMPEKGLISLEGMETWQLPAASEDLGGPDWAFVYAWAFALLDDVLESVKTSCLEANQEKHWGVFSKTILDPTLRGARKPALSEVCRELAIESEAKASNMCITVKRRFKAALRVHVRQFVDRDDQVDAEIQDLIQILSHGRAGPS